MNTLRDLQHEFMAYLLDHSSDPIIERVTSTPQRSASQRMALYGDAYVLRLKEALRHDYERLHAYLGDDLFDTLMQTYIEHYPSHYTNLRYFGQHMVELVTNLAPFDQYPEIGELARIEMAFADSFDAADCITTTLDHLLQLDPANWAALRLQFHASVNLLPLQFNSFQIWRALSNEEIPPDKIADDTTWLVWRQDLVSRYRALDHAELAALSMAHSGGTFADVCSVLLEHYSAEETPLKAVNYLKQWINDRLICSLNTDA